MFNWIEQKLIDLHRCRRRNWCTLLFLLFLVCSYFFLSRSNKTGHFNMSINGRVYNRITFADRTREKKKKLLLNGLIIRKQQKLSNNQNSMRFFIHHQHQHRYSRRFSGNKCSDIIDQRLLTWIEYIEQNEGRHRSLNVWLWLIEKSFRFVFCSSNEREEKKIVKKRKWRTKDEQFAFTK